MLYVGRARDLRARLRSYFRTERQRPAVEAALGALERIEWRVLGSELEAALEELRLIRELRPPANARSTRPDRLRLPPPARRRARRHARRRRALGPIRAAGAGRSARARALDGPASGERLRRRRCRALRARLRDLARACASRTRLGCATGSPRSSRSRRARASSSDCARGALPPRPGRRGRLPAGVLRRRRARRRGAHAAARRRGRARARGGARGGRARASRRAAAEDADELLLVGSFLRRPPPELRVAPSRSRELAAGRRRAQ